MARTKKKRTIQKAPHFQGFKPLGVQEKTSTVIINLEEYETIKLCDYELMTQEEAAVLMNISRPTFTRIYQNARKKVATAFVEANYISFEGGSFSVIQWYNCNVCKTSFTISNTVKRSCPLCKRSSIIEI